MTEDRLRQLIANYLNKSLSEEESIELEEYAGQDPRVKELMHRMGDEHLLSEDLVRYHRGEQQTAASWETIRDRIGQEPRARERRIPFMRWMVAASVILIVAGIFIWKNHNDHSSGVIPVALTTPIIPGSNKAVLTLADGSRVALDKAPDGLISEQASARVSKSDSATLRYVSLPTSSSSHVASSEMAALHYNMLTTPKAGQFMVVLPDGTKVWLNNASSLRYPVSFGPAGREVELTGEAYFEVAKDVRRPFVVKLGGLAIDVLGTNFNVKAYGDESTITTTLLEGKVRLKGGERSQVLAPREQVETGAGGWKLSKGVDIDEAVSWKNGFFNFDHADLPNVMRQLARWYDVEVEYQGTIPPQVYQGGIHRDLPLEEILRNLSNSEVHFRREGRKIIVSS